MRGGAWGLVDVGWVCSLEVLCTRATGQNFWVPLGLMEACLQGPCLRAMRCLNAVFSRDSFICYALILASVLMLI